MICSGIKSKVLGYIDDVLSGEIVVCKLTRLAVERHVRDLEQQRTPEFPYYFNERHAEVACDFFPLMLRHSIGDFAGMPFELEPWQAFGIWVLFGWKREVDDSRRFRKFYDSEARKNGKSTKAAGIALLMAMLDVNPSTGSVEEVAEVILSATKKEQVEKVIYAEIERIRLRSPSIEKCSSRINKQITFKHNQGSIRCVGSDKPYDGLNPLCVLMDELHAWREHHRKFYDTMQTGSGNRSQPLIGTVTTAGDDTSHLWLEEYNYASGVLDGTIKDESFFALVYEIDKEDDPLDESTWIKANPNLGVSVKIDYLRDQAKQAAASKLALNRFTRYHCNRLVTSTEKAFDLEQWDACEGELSDWHEADALGGGVDLGGRDDLAAWGLVARFPMDGEDSEGRPIYRYEIKTKSYIVADTERDLAKQPFANWVHGGHLVKTTRAIADLRDDLIEECSEYGVHAVAFDPYNAQQFGDDLTEEGITAAAMAQNTGKQNEPIRDLLRAIKDGRVTHDGNPLLRWAIGNAVIARDRKDQWMFDKKTSGEKIDPVVAMTMAFRMACVAPARSTGSLYL